MALNYADMDRYSSDGGNAFQGMLNQGSSMGSYLEKLKAYEEASKGLSPELKQVGLLGMPGLFGAEPIPWEGEGGQKARFDYQMGKLEEAALKKAAMNEKANDRALFNTIISKFGDNIARGLGGPGWDTIERNRATGLAAINNINPSTLQPLTTAQFQSRNYYS
jgi:hypothetical protein